MRKLMWWCSWSSYDEEFKDQLKKLGQLLKKTARDLVNFPPRAWFRAYFDTQCKNMMVDNNFTKSFNSWILVSKGKPKIKMLEEIRAKVMNLSIIHVLNCFDICHRDSTHLQASPKIVGEEDDLEQIQAATQDFEPYGPDVGNEENSPLRLMVYPESESWVEKFMTRGVPTGTRKIIFTGDHTGVSVPINLPYSPVKTTWKGKKGSLF
ncbi:hypothetical protein BC332_03328 [Capsicum chinense]|nr:hypothetical protein BC332_03328 [Capsicum chinense]